MHQTSNTTVHKCTKKLIAYNFHLKSSKNFTSKHESGSEFQKRDTRLIKNELKTS